MTRKLLHIDASARGAESESRQLSQTFVAHWLDAHPEDRVTVRDIITDPLPHLNEALLTGLMAAAAERDPQQTAAAARADELVTEFLFGFLGIDDVRVIQAEGLSMGDQREPMLSAAQAAIASTFAATGAAAAPVAA